MEKPRKIKTNGRILYDILVRKHSNMVHVVFEMNGKMPKLVSAWEVGFSDEVYNENDAVKFESNHPGLLQKIAKNVS